CRGGAWPIRARLPPISAAVRRRGAFLRGRGVRRPRHEGAVRPVLVEVRRARVITSSCTKTAPSLPTTPIPLPPAELHTVPADSPLRQYTFCRCADRGSASSLPDEKSYSTAPLDPSRTCGNCPRSLCAGCSVRHIPSPKTVRPARAECCSCCGR